MATTVQQGARQPASEITAEWRDRIESAKRYRRRFEPQWRENQSRAAGKLWLELARDGRRMLLPTHLRDKLERGIRLYTVDLLTQYLQAAKATIAESGDFRSQVAFADDDSLSEDYAEQANDALTFAWEHEIEADRVIDNLLDYLPIYGTIAGRCRWDPTRGPVYAEQVPHLNGRPILDPAQAQAAVAASLEGSGPRVELRDLRGRITWDALTPWQFLVPPGFTREEQFPWEVIISLRSVESIVAEYPQADGIGQQPLESMDVLGLREMGDTESLGMDAGLRQGELDGQVLQYTAFERPCPRYPQGRTVVLAGEQYLFLEERPELSYMTPSGDDYRSGVTYFHYARLPHRFYSRGLVDLIGSGIRNYCRVRQNMTEIVARGQPHVYVEEGSLPEHKRPKGLPMEIIEMQPGRRRPDIVQGVGPGPWMAAELEIILREIAESSGIREVSLGENAANVTTFGQLSLLDANDKRKLARVGHNLRAGVNTMIEDTLYDIQRYWPPGKQLAIAGEDGQVKATRYSGAPLPSGYYVRPAKGSSLPRYQAAEVQKVTDIVSYAASIGQPVSPQWYLEALNAGKAIDLPPSPTEIHREKARWEDEQMGRGRQMPVQYYDEHVIHLGEHRARQIEAEIAGNALQWQIEEMHCQMHLGVLQQIVARQRAQAMEAAAAETAARSPESNDERTS